MGGTQHQDILVLKFAYLKDLDDVDTFNIIGVDGEKVTGNRRIARY